MAALSGTRGSLPGGVSPCVPTGKVRDHSDGEGRIEKPVSSRRMEIGYERPGSVVLLEYVKRLRLSHTGRDAAYMAHGGEPCAGNHP